MTNSQKAAVTMDGNISYANGISANAMATLLKQLTYNENEIAQALYDNYPMLSASSLAVLLHKQDLFPELMRNDLIAILLSVGYSQSQTLNAVTPIFPTIELTAAEQLQGTIGTTKASTVLTYVLSDATRWLISYEQADYYYNQPDGPAIKISDAPGHPELGMFVIGNAGDKYKKQYLGPYSRERFRTTDDIKQQISNLLAYGLQQVYPPDASGGQ